LLSAYSAFILLVMACVMRLTQRIDKLL